MPKLTYRIEHAPGRVYGKNSNELVFKESASGATIYRTTTESGVLKDTKKQLLRGGPTSDKDGDLCVATIEQPGHGRLLELHHPTEDDSSLSTKLKLEKTSSWVPFTGNNNHAVTFNDVKYTWTGASQVKRDEDGKVVAKVSGPWFWQGKLGDMEVDIPEDGDEGREVLEMVLATWVQRWWEEKAADEERAREEKRKQEVKKRMEKEEKRVAAEVRRDEERKKEMEAVEEEEKRKRLESKGQGKLS